jgi:chromosome partitioning protein
MIIAGVANQKGGVGKTALSTHHVLSLAERNKKVLFIDNDPQGNGSYTLGKSEHSNFAPFETLDLYSNDPLPDFTPDKLITIVKADRKLAKVARYESEAPFIFKENLEKISHHFDYCIIDNPPTLGLGLIAFLVCCDFVYSPLELSDYSIQGLKDLRLTIEGVKSRHNPKLEHLGFIPNRLNSRDANQKEKFSKLLAAFPNHMIKAAIVQRGSIAEALEKGLPVWKIQKEKSAAKQATIEIRAALDFIELKMGETEKLDVN